MQKILNRSYGSIGHIQGSRMTTGDKIINNNMQQIATVKTRDKNDIVIVEEKLDGSNVGVVKQDGKLYPIIRTGYLASESSYLQHVLFSEWVFYHQKRFEDVLGDGERLCGEWLLQAHGTRYNLPHEPFVLFDIFSGERRLTIDEVNERTQLDFVRPRLIHFGIGNPFSVQCAIAAIETSGHGAIDSVEGAIWRIEREKEVDFLAKFVRPDRVDGYYLPGINKNIMGAVWNTFTGDEWLQEKLPSKKQDS